MKIKINLINEPAKNYRKRASEEALQALADSIREIGLLEPILVLEHYQHDAEPPCTTALERENCHHPEHRRYDIIAGRRRYWAHRMLCADEIDAIVLDLNKQQADFATLIENNQREDVELGDEAEYLFTLKDKYQLTNLALAKMIGRSRQYVDDRLRFLEWDAAVRDAVSSGKLPFSSGKIIMTEPRPEHREYLLRNTLQFGASGATIEAWKQALNAIDYGSIAAMTTPPTQPNELPERPAHEKLYLCELGLEEVVIKNYNWIGVCSRCLYELRIAQSHAREGQEAT